MEKTKLLVKLPSGKEKEYPRNTTPKEIFENEEEFKEEKEEIIGAFINSYMISSKI
jgi:hypothetical protein